MDLAQMPVSAANLTRATLHDGPGQAIIEATSPTFNVMPDDGTAGNS